METLAPGGVDATAIGLGPLCTMVAQPVMALHALNMANTDICLNMTTPVLGSIAFLSRRGWGTPSRVSHSRLRY